MAQDVILVRRAEQRRMPWKNGAGFTTELALRPAEGPEFDWRVSVAEVEVDCDFSRFPGVDRSILVLTGGGFALHVDDDPPVHLRPGAPAFAFAGERATRCVVAGGPSRDFNVMTRRTRCTHALTTHALAGEWAIDRPAGLTCVVYLVEGDAEVGAGRLAPGDCALVEAAPEDRPPLHLRGAGRLVLVRLRPA